MKIWMFRGKAVSLPCKREGNDPQADAELKRSYMDAKEILIFSSRAESWENIIGVYDNEDTTREQISEFFSRRNDDTDGREEALELLLYGEYFDQDSEFHYMLRRVELNKTDYEACTMITKWGVCEIG